MLPAARSSPPGSPLRAGLAAEGPGSGGRRRARGLGLGRPPEWAPRPAERSGSAGARAEHRRTAGPLVLWKNLGGSCSRVRGTRRGSVPGRRPSPTCYARFPPPGRAPSQHLLLPGLSPEPRGGGRRQGSPRAKAGQGQRAFLAFPVSKVPAAPEPGVEGKPRPKRLPPGSEGVGARWGWGWEVALFARAPAPLEP